MKAGKGSNKTCIQVNVVKNPKKKGERCLEMIMIQGKDEVFEKTYKNFMEYLEASF